jgi:4-amino-4-deoxy-L-arabinose transferase-like glycosyltransferase
MRMPSILLSTLAISLTYGIGTHLFSKRIALLAAGFQAINGHVIALAAGRVGSDHVDTLLVVLIAVGVFLAARQKTRGGVLLLCGVGLCTGLAVLTKWLVALLIPAIWLSFVYQRERAGSLMAKLMLILAVATAIGAPWQVYIWRAFPQEAAWEADYNLKHLFVPVEGHRHPPYYYFLGLRHTFGELIYIPIVWFLVFVGHRRRTAHEWPIVIWFLVPYVVFSCAATKMLGYVTVAAPAVFLMAAAFWWRLRETVGKVDYGRAQHVGTVLLLALLILLPIRHTLEHFKVWSASNPNPEWTRLLRTLEDRTRHEKVVLFNWEWPIEAMFYISHPAYSHVPTEAEIQELQTRGYRVLVYNRGEMPPNFLHDPRITILEAKQPYLSIPSN